MSLSKILLLSDIDGTLLPYRSTIPQRNLDAIEYFKSLGGKFALATGRSVEAARRALSNMQITNFASVVYNGGAIYDYKNEKMLLTYSLPEDAAFHVFDILEKFPNIGIEIHVDCIVYCVSYSEISKHHMSIEGRECVITEISDLPKGHWNKVLFTGYKDAIDELIEYLSTFDISEKDYYFLRSEKTFYELLPKKATKGNGLRILAEMLGVSVDNTYAIGDYYNDADLLKTAGFSATVEEAPDEIKALAGYITCPCADGAVADFIEYIIKKSSQG